MARMIKVYGYSLLNLYCMTWAYAWNNQYTFNASALLSSVKTKLKERFVSFWKERLSSEEGMKNTNL